MWMVYTEPGGGVAITSPAPEFMKAATNGGDPLTATLPIDEWVWRKTQQGHFEDAAYRHAKAWHFGRYSLAGAWRVIRDIEPRYVPKHVVVLAPEIVGREFFPQDGGYFRRAWRRREDGGSIWTDIPTARLIHLYRAEAAVKQWNRREQVADDLAVLEGRLTNGPAFIEFDRRRMRDALLRIETPEAIRAIWPEGLPLKGTTQ